MVAEPKPHQTGRKRQNVTKTGNDCNEKRTKQYVAVVGLLALRTLSHGRAEFHREKTVAASGVASSGFTICGPKKTSRPTLGNWYRGP
ncbi:hypothetical protein K0M31_019812 [Melipona bicolor]|uniref:Uncharacterized protein n=1 Tax=Melipona bicolor TaxID=60889 RepID=A0AA40G361_9HYME|nr:hypothetical protein K0M31_019812 [Melipona bicolor]